MTGLILTAGLLTAVAGTPVTRIIDGDTFEVWTGGKIEKVRLVGIDTPELKSKVTTKKGCYAREAKAYLEKRLAGRKVVLLRDTTQANRDNYGRLLRYAYLGMEDIGLTLVNGGYAREYTYGGGYANRRIYNAAQSAARGARRGLWSRWNCPVNQ